MEYSIRKFILLIALAIALTGISCQTKNNENQGDNNAAVQSQDEAEDRNDAKFETRDNEKNAAFVVDAVSSSLTEVQLANLAESKATNTEVKSLASMLKKDHNELLGNLKKYAAEKVISVPNAPDSSKIDNLADEKNNFDKEWCERVKDLHENSIKRFEDASNDLADAELKNLATTTLPTLRTHYDKIVACQEKLK